MHTWERNGTFPSFRFPPNCWSAKLNTKELWMSFYISKSDEKADIVGGGSTSSSAIFSPRVNMNTENKKLCGWNKQYTTFHAPHSLLVFCAALFTYVSFFSSSFYTVMKTLALRFPAAHKNGNEKTLYLCLFLAEVLFLMSRMEKLFAISLFGNIMHIILIKKLVRCGRALQWSRVFMHQRLTPDINRHWESFDVGNFHRRWLRKSY